jgi:hypothetical protein
MKGFAEFCRAIKSESAINEISLIADSLFLFFRPGGASSAIAGCREFADTRLPFKERKVEAVDGGTNGGYINSFVAFLLFHLGFVLFRQLLGHAIEEGAEGS